MKFVKFRQAPNLHLNAKQPAPPGHRTRPNKRWVTHNEISGSAVAIPALMRLGVKFGGLVLLTIQLVSNTVICQLRNTGYY
jgi:hypothetical protein